MSLYFFSLRFRPGIDGLALDEEGDDLLNVGAVREHALAMARDLIGRHRMQVIRDWMVCSFEITDEEGRHVMTVPFGDTVPVLEGLDDQ